MVGTQDSRVLTHVGTRPSRVQAEESDPRAAAGLPITWARGRAARHDRGVPRDDPLPRRGGRRARCGPASSSGSGCRPRPSRRPSAASSTGAGSSSRATAACSLTTKGRGLATTIVRRHRLAERLLVDVIGLEWEKVHAEAARWEHAISADVEEKLVLLLGDPATCPHGNPIPGSLHAVAVRADDRARRRRGRSGHRRPRRANGSRCRTKRSCSSPARICCRAATRRSSTRTPTA